MSGVERLPEWLATGLLGAVIAALGYVTKLFVDFWMTQRRARDERDARLLELESLLKASGALYKTQCVLRGRLSNMIDTRMPELRGQPYDRKFSNAYKELNSEETDLHSIIRGMTEHALRGLNLSLSAWLKADVTFKLGYKSSGPWQELAAKLSQFEAHLLMWHAKYRQWIPDRPDHALVYLADEEAHGVGFPRGLDALVAKLVEQRHPHRPMPTRQEIGV